MLGTAAVSVLTTLLPSATTFRAFGFATGNPANGGPPTAGCFDEVALYTKALSTRQVAEHDNAGRR